MRTPRLPRRSSCSPSPRSWLGACGGSSDDDGDASSEGTSTSCSRRPSRATSRWTLARSRWPSRWRPRARAPMSCRARSSARSTGRSTRPTRSRCRSSRSRPAFEGAGQSLSAGATSTGDKGFVSFQGTDYVVADQVFQQFKAQYEQARAQTEGQRDQAQSLATLGLDPRKWLTDPQNAGEAQVGDTDTIKITAGIDVNKLLDDANSALAAACRDRRGAGPGHPGEADRQAEAAGGRGDQGPEDRDLHGQGRQDHAPHGAVARPRGRRAPPARSPSTSRSPASTSRRTSPSRRTRSRSTSCSGSSARSAPWAAPAAAGSGSGSGSGSGGANGGGGAGAGDFEAYSECLTKAGDDVQKARDCADLLAP